MPKKQHFDEIQFEKLVDSLFHRVKLIDWTVRKIEKVFISEHFKIYPEINTKSKEFNLISYLGSVVLIQ